MIDGRKLLLLVIVLFAGWLFLGCGGLTEQIRADTEMAFKRCVPEATIALCQCGARVALEEECKRAASRSDRLPFPGCTELLPKPKATPPTAATSQPVNP